MTREGLNDPRPKQDMLGLFVLNKLVLVYGFGLNSVSYITANAHFGINLVTSNQNSV